jgi:hypothetical protein
MFKNLIFGAGAGVLISACTATVESTPPPTVAASVEADVGSDDVTVVESVPSNVYVYPHTVYNGRTVYWVNGRWFYPHGSRWYAYRREPPGLVRQRPYVQQAPPAYQPYPQQAPPAYRPVPEAVPVR